MPPSLEQHPGHIGESGFESRGRRTIGGGAG